MADVRELKPFILKWKGSFVNDPADLGGATDKGVTIGTYKEYRKKKGLSVPSDLQSDGYVLTDLSRSPVPADL